MVGVPQVWMMGVTPGLDGGGTWGIPWPGLDGGGTPGLYGGGVPQVWMVVGTPSLYSGRYSRSGWWGVL